LKNTNRPLVSIITVTYNAAADLETTILSVANQTYEPIEYWVIDGSSADNTQAIIKKYEACITHWISEPDGGIYDAMNKGINLSKGDGLLFLNAGDTLTPDAIARMVAEANGDITDRFICCDWTIVYPHSSKKNHRTASFDFNHKNGICHQGALIGRNIKKKIGFYDLNYRYVADYEFYIRVWRAMPQAFLRVPAYLCVFKYEGATTLNILKSNKERWRVISTHFSWAESLHLRLVTAAAIIIRSLKKIIH
jgi:glycosyltransferase involved in cell wall biosynthesis